MHFPLMYQFRSNIPKEELENFLKEQVLSKYTFLFEQTKENGAPDGTTDLQVSLPFIVFGSLISYKH